MYSPVGAGAVGSVVDGCPEVDGFVVVEVDGFVVVEVGSVVGVGWSEIDGWFDAEGFVVS